VLSWFFAIPAWLGITPTTSYFSSQLGALDHSVSIPFSYRIFITPKNIVFPMIVNFLSRDSTSGILITSIRTCLMSGFLIIYIMFLIWCLDNQLCVQSICILIRVGYIRAHVWNLKLSWTKIQYKGCCFLAYGQGLTQPPICRDQKIDSIGVTKSNTSQLQF